MSTFKIVISHFSFIIQSKGFWSFKRVKCVLSILQKFLLVVKILIKKHFFPGLVFENKTVKQISNHNNLSATINSKIIAPSKNTFQNKYKNCEFMGIYKCFNNKNVFTTIRVVWVNGVSGQKPQNGQFKAF